MTLILSSSLHLPKPSPKPNHQTSSQSQSPNLIHTFANPFELKQVHTHLIKTNTPLSILALVRVGSVCAFTTDFAYARSIFQCIDDVSEFFSWNSCLKSFSEGDSPIDTIRLFYKLRWADILPDTFSCAFLFKACSLLRDVKNGRIVHGYVEKLGFGSDLYLQNNVVNLYTCCEETEDARLMFDKMPQRDVVSWNIIITHLTKREGRIEEARDLLDKMPKRSVRSWTSMIAGYVQCGQAKEAVKLFTEMEEAGERPNEVTVVAVLAACADLGALDLGRRVHEYSNRCRYQSNVRVCNTLIDMYIKCGCLEVALQVFNEMKERTVVSWSAMIGGLAMHGRAEEALEMFAKMSRIGIRPNVITFVGLLHACSHMGLVDEGRKFFASMTKDYGIVPQIEHYGCMVDLLGRSGLLQEAYEFIMNMPIEANGVVWGALLGACKLHKNVDLAEEAIKHLMVLDPYNNGYFVVLSNIYAEAGRWEDVARARKLMRDQGIKKIPGWSTIAVNGTVHEFVAGDVDHPKVEEIHEKWDELLTQMKSRGYVADTSIVLLDVDNDKKERFLYHHSEKLAVVFGLMNTPPGTPIRIMKNLRVCEDCHAALKLISEISSQEIVVRDRNRFHCFKDGSCSCKDYW